MALDLKSCRRLFNCLLTYPFYPVQQLRVLNVANAIQAAGGYMCWARSSPLDSRRVPGILP
jgi:hypothetical protein